MKSYDLCLSAECSPQSAIIQCCADWTDGYVLCKISFF